MTLGGDIAAALVKTPGGRVAPQADKLGKQASTRLGPTLVFRNHCGCRPTAIAWLDPPHQFARKEKRPEWMRAGLGDKNAVRRAVHVQNNAEAIILLDRRSEYAIGIRG